MIELQDVSLQAGAFSLTSISLKVEAGEFAVLMGPTGIGKTTILEAICGLRTVTAGSILIDGRDVTSFLPGDRGIGYVPQDLALFPDMKVRDQLAFALKLRKAPRRQIAERIEQLSQQLHITHLMDRTPQGLSGGERQRVALGRAISFEPQVLLLDEPFSALDETTRNEMSRLLKKLTERSGITTLHVTHSEFEADLLSTRRFVLDLAGVRELRDSTDIVNH